MIFDSRHGWGRRTLQLLGAWILTVATQADEVAQVPAAPSKTPISQVAECVVLPDVTRPVHLRLNTHPSPAAAGLFNTFEIEAYGEKLLPGVPGEVVRRWLASPTIQGSPHPILVNGMGPSLSSTNEIAGIETASGPDWRYAAFDASGPYQKSLKVFRRGILFVEPDLFAIHDHLEVREPCDIQQRLQVPAATRLDPVWGDLRLDLPRAGLTVQTAAARKQPRTWERIESVSDGFLPGTVTMRISLTNVSSGLDLLTVFSVYRAGDRSEIATKLLEGNSAVGARIHRAGLPTLVAFKTGSTPGPASLTGFEFSGPVGVSVFRPKARRP